MFVPMANVLVEGSTFWTRKIDVSKRHLLRAVSTPPYPLPKKQLLSETKRRTDFDQSNFALSNVRALRAKIETNQHDIACLASTFPISGFELYFDFRVPAHVLHPVGRSG